MMILLIACFQPAQLDPVDCDQAYNEIGAEIWCATNNQAVWYCQQEGTCWYVAGGAYAEPEDCEDGRARREAQRDIERQCGGFGAY